MNSGDRIRRQRNATKHRILILGFCLVLVACSTGGTKIVTRASSHSQPSLVSLPAPPTLPPDAANEYWHRDTGITDSGAVMSHDRVCVNSYGNPYKGGWVGICAGGKQDGSSGSWIFEQGAIWVNLNPDPRVSGPITQEPPDSPTYEYDAPNSRTWVKITNVTGDIVNLQRETGSKLSFNLQTQQFS